MAVSFHASSSVAFQTAWPLTLRSTAFHQKSNSLFQQLETFKSLSSTSQNESTSRKELPTDTSEFYADPARYPDFASLGISSPALLQRLSSPPLNLSRPSAVQAATFDTISLGENVIVGAETGTGKTLAYLLPLVEDVLKRKREWKARQLEKGEGEEDAVMDPGYSFARAIILVPNKELAHQAVRMAASICGGLSRCVVWGSEGVMAGMNMDLYEDSNDEDVPEEDIVRLALLPGGLSSPFDYPPFRFASEIKASSKGRQPPPDLVFATPANLGPMGLSPKNIELFADVATLVVDEADMLLDGGYVRQLNNVLMGFRRADRLVGRYDSMSFGKKKSDNEDEDFSDDFDDYVEDKKPKSTQHVFVAATLPDYGLRSVDAYLNRKFPDALKISMAGMHNARHYGLEQESQTVWNEIAENKDRMKRLVDLLRLDRSEVGVDGRGLKEEKVMVFLNTVNDADGATNGLRRAGINAVPYHAQVPLEERASNLDKFRRYRAPSNNNGCSENDEDTVPVLVCTDLASRGLDIPGVTAVVQLQFATNVVIHLHRMGRCGRAGAIDGRGIIFYGPTEKELVDVVREAEEQQSRMTLSQDVDDGMDSDMVDGEGQSDAGKVKKAFSRRRGFTKKRKKERREQRDAAMGYD
ncbi:hypothetical protein HJC23_008524 [Cyclotella cryptica]|uniref:P-loop containing nucleoside triphosphate hydrolase protein n=1 Tax=Cyclotella cryptica TaxID=29204 RepID=A0ABD3QWU5_9STRA